MGPEAYGQLGLGMTIAGFLSQFVYGPLGQAVFRFYSVYRERRTLSVYFHAVVRMHVLLAVVVVIFCSASVAAVSTWVSGEWAWLTAAALLFGLISGANGFFLAANTAMRARKIVALHEGADAWLRIACAVGGLYFFGNRGFIALMGYLLGTLLVTLSQTVFFSGVGATSHTVAAV